MMSPSLSSYTHGVDLTRIIIIDCLNVLCTGSVKFVTTNVIDTVCSRLRGSPYVAIFVVYSSYDRITWHATQCILGTMDQIHGHLVVKASTDHLSITQGS